jgi:NAD(P)-dependent dehydrogenase (short-subunit alcohol dehydrogenase family)
MTNQFNHAKVALITGANKGIGFETARQLGRLGITVLLGARDAKRGQHATEILRGEGLEARLVVLDVTDQSTIDAAAVQIEREFGRLDILVNNAGVFVEKQPASRCQLENLRRTFETNFFGAFAVTKAFLPLLRKSEAGRIVNLASDLASLGNTSDPQWALYEHVYFAYASSKVAINAMTVALAKDLRDTPIKVNSADPGFTATDMNGHTGPKKPEQAALVPVRLATLPPDGPTGGYFDENGPVPW